MQDLYGDFLDETANSIALVERELRTLAARPGEGELLAAIFRHVHSIKGTCGFLGIQPLEDAAHAMEEDLACLRPGRRPRIGETFARLWPHVAKMRAIVEQLSADAGDGSADIWANLPRLVDDLARKLGRQVELRITGDIDALEAHLLVVARDALIHIIRNAIDHGIETPAERRAAGKRERGRLDLHIRRDGRHVVVDIADDGRGLDVPALRRRVAADGAVDAAGVAAMSDVEIGRHVFRPGITTADRVTILSGRGVGLDAVRTAVGEFGGQVEVVSEPGRGTCFTFRLPAGSATVRPRRAVR